MNPATKRLADALHEAEFELEEVAAILSAINIAVVVADKTYVERFPYGNPAAAHVARARSVGELLRKYTLDSDR